jgi:hypothetical protein
VSQISKLVHRYTSAPRAVSLTADDLDLLLGEGAEQDIYMVRITAALTDEQRERLDTRARELHAQKETKP